MDKDAGQIAAIQEAWSWTANIQLCLWHVKHAIDRKLRDKKYKSSQYTARKAKEANEQFQFIDAFWIPGDNEGILCPQDKRKEVLNMVKRLAIHFTRLYQSAKKSFLPQWRFITRVSKRCIDIAKIII